MRNAGKTIEPVMSARLIRIHRILPNILRDVLALERTFLLNRDVWWRSWQIEQAAYDVRLRKCKTAQKFSRKIVYSQMVLSDRREWL